VYGLEEEANRMDMELMNKEFKGFSYLSYKRSTPAQRIAAMHYNDVINVKSRYEVLFDANVDDIVMFKEEEKILKEILFEANDNEERLFLAAEQGAGAGKNNIQVILNPQMKFKARKWLVEIYPEIIFKNQTENKTSVRVEEFTQNNKYNEDLKAFLTPVLQNKAATQVKKYGLKVKSYAQALGIVNTNGINSISKSKLNGKSKEKSDHTVKKKSDELRQLEDTVKTLTDQINALTQIVKELCGVVQDPEKKKQVLSTLEKFTDKGAKESEDDNQNQNEITTNGYDNNDTEVVEIEKNQKKEKEILGKRKMQSTPYGYNIKQDDLTGKIAFKYTEIGDLAVLRKRRVDKLTQNE